MGLTHDDLLNRLYNGKYETASSYVKRLPPGTVAEEDAELIESLSRTLGDAGWLYGDLGTIVARACHSIPGFTAYQRAADKEG